MNQPTGFDDIDIARLKGLREMFKGIGEDPDREGLKDTPARVIKAWRELCGGYKQDPSKLLTTFDGEDYDEMISVGPIAFYSTCEHHLLPFFGDAWVAYIPGKTEVMSVDEARRHPYDPGRLCCVYDPEALIHTPAPKHYAGKIIGLSKLPRLVEIYARRLQNQERMTKQIVTTLTNLLAPRGAACFVRARHFCMMARGVKQSKAQMSTSKLTGCFMEPAVRAEFFELTKERA